MTFLINDVTVEDAIELFLTTIPRCVELSRARDCDGEVLDDSAITNAAAGMFLFLLADRLSCKDDQGIRRIRRAFEVMWTSIHSVGGNAKDARSWLIYFSERVEGATAPADRAAMITRAVRQRLYSSEEVKCPLDQWPHAIAAGLDGLRGFGIRGDN